MRPLFSLASLMLFLIGHSCNAFQQSEDFYESNSNRYYLRKPFAERYLTTENEQQQAPIYNYRSLLYRPELTRQHQQQQQKNVPEIDVLRKYRQPIDLDRKISFQPQNYDLDQLLATIQDRSKSNQNLDTNYDEENKQNEDLNNYDRKFFAQSNNQNQPRRDRGLSPKSHNQESSLSSTRNAAAAAVSADDGDDDDGSNIFDAEHMRKKSELNDEQILGQQLLQQRHHQQAQRNYPSARLISEQQIRTPKAFHQQSYDRTISFTDSSFNSLSDFYFIALVACVSAVAIFSVIGAGYCFYRVQQNNKAAADVDFPSYGVIGPAKRFDSGVNNITDTKPSPTSVSPSNDRKLVQSAQIYHYHHQKQQMISTEKNPTIPKANNGGSDIESDEENEYGEYTVYECPGLAPTGEMEIKNPLFQDDITPMSSPPVNSGNVSSGGGGADSSKNSTPKTPERNKSNSNSINSNLRQESNVINNSK
ncbi:Neural proliferation differentiation and control protein 1 [Sarcoptes scabiei]|uniref:Neural proliferation differentiation and control protein 1 n=1 Tax=Sarcoptes scabiei TaxID=52283 RepID=A0A834RBX8_SARSC|nr:Neural proliferation differentiation and control protein 1 [Sarcoptes scabiei]